MSISWRDKQNVPHQNVRNILVRTIKRDLNEYWSAIPLSDESLLESGVFSQELAQDYSSKHTKHWGGSLKTEARRGHSFLGEILWMLFK